jgi:hypothetical protein
MLVTFEGINSGHILVSPDNLSSGYAWKDYTEQFGGILG